MGDLTEYAGVLLLFGAEQFLSEPHGAVVCLIDNHATIDAEEDAHRNRPFLRCQVSLTRQREHRRQKDIELTIGSLGIWRLTKTDYSEQRRTLISESWTAFPRGSHTWASATPVVLDRFPKTDRAKDREGWLNEVADTIANSCEQIQLPRPILVEIDTTSWLRGVPRAIATQRRLRGNSGSHAVARLGDGFPAYPAKGTNASRPQVHVRLVFEQPVVGPVSIGAGRFFGYGFCKPLKGQAE